MLEILKQHGYECTVVQGRTLVHDLYALEGDEGRDLVDITDWRLDRLLHWLGY